MNRLGHDKLVLRNLASLRAPKKCLEVIFQNNVIFPLKKRCNIITKPSIYKKISRTINSFFWYNQFWIQHCYTCQFRLSASTLKKKIKKKIILPKNIICTSHYIFSQPPHCRSSHESLWVPPTHSFSKVWRASSQHLHHMAKLDSDSD